MTPSRIGRTTWMRSGARPSISRACRPTASTRLSASEYATTDGSLSTTPRPLTYTRTFAVPRSMPIAFPNMLMPSTTPTWANVPGTAHEAHTQLRQRSSRDDRSSTVSGHATLAAAPPPYHPQLDHRGLEGQSGRLNLDRVAATARLAEGMLGLLASGLSSSGVDLVGAD